MRLGICWVLVALAMLLTGMTGSEVAEVKKNAYAAMMYMGTPRDYEFYVATRVMMRSLRMLKVDADLVVIASDDVPTQWVQSLKIEDGVKVVTVKNLRNPYEFQGNFNPRFKLTMNKLYAWSLIDYDRVVMLDSDNLFLQKTDELFQCGQFCAVFINPCIFHTGLFVLQPSMEVFNNMLHELDVGRSNPDGADQGFLVSYFPDLLNRPMFYPPKNGSKVVNGFYRLPLGYQMDHSYFYLKLRWSIPCGPNSVITFPSAPSLKPWYWYSWPILPLGLSWHEQRRQTLGYGAELPVAMIQCAMYTAIIIVTHLARPGLSKLCYNRRTEKSIVFLTALKVGALCSILVSYIVPFLIIPLTIHPLIGWPLYLLGSLALSSIVINVFLLPSLAILTPWIGIFVSLFVLACPWYSNGIVRAILVCVYASFCTPFIWASFTRINTSLHLMIEREAFYPRLGESSQGPEFSKLY